jgi:hypothetical protein
MQAFLSQARFLRNGRHTSYSGDLANRCQEYTGVVFFKCGRQRLGNSFLTIEVGTWVEFCDFNHVSHSAPGSGIILQAWAMPLFWLDFSPPQRIARPGLRVKINTIGCSMGCAIGNGNKKCRGSR